MIAFKIIIFIVLSIIAIVVFAKNFKNWTTKYRSYMIENSKKTFGNGMVWEKPFGKIIVKIMYFILVFLVVFGIYVVVFS